MRRILIALTTMMLTAGVAVAQIPFYDDVLITGNVNILGNNTNAFAFRSLHDGMSELRVYTQDTSENDYGSSSLLLSPEQGFLISQINRAATSYSAIEMTPDYLSLLKNYSSFYYSISLYDDGIEILDGDINQPGDILTLNAGGYAKWQQFQPPTMTATEASALNPSNGWMIYVTDTDLTFLTVGFWGYENGSWVKL